MTIDRPGRPADLPAPELLWARWALAAVVQASAAGERETGYRTGCWIDDEGLHLDDCGGTWWTFTRVAEGRWVLYGEDESSGAKWYEPPVDMLAGGPDWLPYEELRDRLSGNELGCVYWYEDGAWGRAPYPADLDDDGLDCGMSRFVVRAEALLLLRELAREAVRGPGDAAAVDAAALLELAEAYALTPDELTAAAGEAPELPAMLRELDRAGLGARAAAAG
ncbi:hypothetical protein [Streptomyces sp. NPDC090025]|uniref:hypothetical protein n=1 Tax=Streptomyces sp. NPDC090025 TaxID=3365922 RepID=UPI0038337B06